MNIYPLIQLQPQHSPETMKQQIINIHNQLYDAYAIPLNVRSPGTTLVLADIHRQTVQAVLIHVGDSRAYLILSLPSLILNRPERSLTGLPRMEIKVPKGWLRLPSQN